MISRRDVLATFLGTALAGCVKPRGRALPVGEIAGASHTIGHRIPAETPPVPSRHETHDVVIVGGGIAGLAAAWRLANRGLDVVVLELEPVAGGTSRSGRSSVSAYPWGAHYVPAPVTPNPVLRRLLREAGAWDDGGAREEALVRDPQERIWAHGRWYEGLYLNAGATQEDLRQLRAFEAKIAEWVGWRDAKGRRAFAIPIATASDDAELTALDRMSMDEWMRTNGFTSPRLRWLVDYACRDDYGSFPAQTSAWAGVFYFAARIEQPGNESEPIITWPEGNGRLVAHLARTASIRTGWLAMSITPQEDGAEVVAVRGTEAVALRARRVIYSGPQFLTPYLIAPWRGAPPEHVREFQYAPWMVANLHLRDRPAVHGFPLAWDNVFYDSPSLGYVVATHQSGIDHGPTVLTYYYALCDGNVRTARERLLEADRDDWAEVTLRDMERPHPEIRELTTRLDVMRWGHAMVRPRPGFVRSAALRAASVPYRTIHFANTDLSGVALVEEALDHGVRAAEEVLAALGREEPGWR